VSRSNFSDFDTYDHGHFYDALLMHENKLSWIVSNLYYSLTRFCVPIFFIISAYLVFNNKSNKKWHERLVRLGLPFVAWSAIYYVYGGGRCLGIPKKILKEGANKQVISSQADSLIKISRIWADFFPQTHRISLFRLFFPPFLALFPVFTEISPTDVSFGPPETGWPG
jgi:hypothetical protein